MKLKIKKSERHTEVVCSCCWAPDNKLYSLSNKTILTWDYNGEYIYQFMELDTPCTSIEWGPSSQTSDNIALGTSDGVLKIITKTGKIEWNQNYVETCILFTVNGYDSLYRHQRQRRRKS